MPGGDRSIARRSVLGGSAAALAARALSFPADAASLAEVPPAEKRTDFATDIRLPGLLHAVIARPPLPDRRLAAVDASAALALKHVVAVIPLAPFDAPGLRQLGGVAIVARDTWSALRGRDALRLVWEEAAVTGRDRVESFFVPETAEPLMESPSATVQVDGDSCAVWTGTRDPETLRAVLAVLLGLPSDAVTVRATASACDPGRHANPSYAVDAALLSRAMRGAPVSLTWTAEDDMPFRRRPAWS